MEPVVPASETVGRCVRDELSLLRPAHAVAFHAQQRDKALPALGNTHRVVDGDREAELPALALVRRTVLARGHRFARFRLRFEHGKSVLRADLIAAFPQSFERIWVLPQLVTRLAAHRIDDEMRVQMRRVDVRRDEHFVSRPRFCRELQRDTVCLFRCDLLPRRERLHILIKVHAARFSVSVLRRQELDERIFAVAIHAADVPPPRFVHSFFRLCAVADHAAHRAQALLCLPNIRYGRHLVFSASASSRPYSARCPSSTS